MPDENIRTENAPALNDVYLRTGVYRARIDPADVQLWPTVPFDTNEYGVLVSWDRPVGDWMRVVATGADGKPFGSTAADLEKTFTHHRMGSSSFAATVRSDAWLQSRGFVAGTSTVQSPTRLECFIDTNHPGFVRYAEESGEGGPNRTVDGLLVPLRINFFHRLAAGQSATGQAAGGDERKDRMQLLLVLQPAIGPRQDDWLAAIDLGNTNTTTALLSPEQRSTAKIHLLSVGIVPGGAPGAVIGPDTPPVPSDVRLDLVRSWMPAGQTAPATRRFPDFERHPKDDLGHAASWMVGEIVRRGGGQARSLILGAKRMASARMDGTIPVFADHRVVFAREDDRDPIQSGMLLQVDTRLPLELLACSVLRYYREARKCWPGRLAMTYPTTYSRAELQRIRRAIQCAWLRMQERRRLDEFESSNGEDRELDALSRGLRRMVRGPIDLATQSEDPLVRLVLDEASAAAFFYLYRKIFEEPVERSGRKVYETKSGGLVAFRAVYPDGLNMLLYDCGGGTTDIAIVNARINDDWRTLQITVRFRSGLRDFGGDDITTQIARLLKAKIANLKAAPQQKVTPPNVPTRAPTSDAEWMKLAGQLSLFIDEVRQKDPNDLLVPTRDIGAHPQEDRRAAALALWNLAESIKIRLGELPKGETEVKPDPIQKSDALGRVLLQGTAQQVDEMQKKLQQISISRVEVDALVFAKMLRSIKNCNALIARVAAGDGAPPSEIHWVVASGSAVRYPFIEQMLRSRLDVAFLAPEDDDPEDGRFLFDRENAKNATAKGAVLALSVMENPGSMMKVRFDSDLADRLPFDIGFFSRVTAQDVLLYSEHTHYRELRDQDAVKLPLGDGTIESGGRRFTLRRRFPGDVGYADFIEYRFEEPIRGPHLTVKYDDASPFEFVVYDGEGQEGTPIDLTANEIHRSPAQRGDL